MFIKTRFTINYQKKSKNKGLYPLCCWFFSKRYLSSNDKEPLDFLYKKIQTEVSCELINSQPIDALSLYIINKIINSKKYTKYE